MTTSKQEEWIKDTLVTILPDIYTVYSKEQGKRILDKPKIVDAAFSYQKSLISNMLSNDKIRANFFDKIEVKSQIRTYLFKQAEFIEYIEGFRYLNDSATKFANKIGLGDRAKKYLKQTDKVVLNFPFKDCVLEGGQTADDQKGKELFFNSIIEKEEINKLLHPKAFHNVKLYTNKAINSQLKPSKPSKSTINSELSPEDATTTNLNNPNNTYEVLEQEVTKFNRNEQGTITDNLVIKGNNLLALHSLKAEFSGKIKLIYIDPPYNTGNDSFKYNDNFNHSTWLTFMKNRLEVSKELLKDDGVIFVSIDDNEQAYLKVLMDEVFGRENFVGNLIVTSAPAGTQSSKNIAQQHSYCLIFQKSSMFSSFKIFLTDNNIKQKYNEKDTYGSYYVERLWKRGQGGKKEDVPSLHFPVYYDVENEKIFIDDEAKESKNLIKIIPYQTEGVLGRWTWSKEKMKKDRDKLIVKKVANQYRLHKKKYSNEDEGVLLGTIVDAKIGRTELGSIQIKKVMGDKVFSYPKPEELIERIIRISTQENDIVLDFHAGSGTTGAVAHKMGRQYILVEQMDYIENVTLERLKKVIAGEQGGISKSVEWQGGGEFIYLELAKFNQKYIDDITSSKSIKDLQRVWRDMLTTSLLHYKINITPFQNKHNKHTKEKITINEKEAVKVLEDLNIEENTANFQQVQQILIDSLNKNMLYIPNNFAEFKEYNLTEQDINLTKNFYKANT